MALKAKVTSLKLIKFNLTLHKKFDEQRLNIEIQRASSGFEEGDSNPQDIPTGSLTVYAHFDPVLIYVAVSLFSNR